MIERASVEEMMVQRRCLRDGCSLDATVHYRVKDLPDTPKGMVENTVSCDNHIRYVIGTVDVLAFHQIGGNPCCFPGAIWLDSGCDLDDSGEERPLKEEWDVKPLQG